MTPPGLSRGGCCPGLLMGQEPKENPRVLAGDWLSSVETKVMSKTVSAGQGSFQGRCHGTQAARVLLCLQEQDLECGHDRRGTL